MKESIWLVFLFLTSKRKQQWEKGCKHKFGSVFKKISMLFSPPPDSHGARFLKRFAGVHHDIPKAL